MQVQPDIATTTAGNASASRIGGNPAIGRPALPVQSTLGLIRQLIDEIAALFRDEVALARAEIKESARAATAGLTHLAIGVVVLLVAFFTGVAAAVLLLGLILPAWLAALAVALVTGLGGYGILRSGRRKLDVDRLKPTRAPESLRKDAAILARKHRL